jgi:hypothetical protein
MYPALQLYSQALAELQLFSLTNVILVPVFTFWLKFAHCEAFVNVAGTAGQTLGTHFAGFDLSKAA